MDKQGLMAAFDLLGDLAPAMRGLEARGLGVTADLATPGQVLLRITLPVGHPAAAVRFQEVLGKATVAEAAPAPDPAPAPAPEPDRLEEPGALPEAGADDLSCGAPEGPQWVLGPVDAPVTTIPGFTPSSDLERHLWTVTRKAGWDIRADAELMHFACLDWPMQAIAAEIGRDAKEVKARFELLTEGRTRPRLVVHEALERMLRALDAEDAA